MGSVRLALAQAVACRQHSRASVTTENSGSARTLARRLAAGRRLLIVGNGNHRRHDLGYDETRFGWRLGADTRIHRHVNCIAPRSRARCRRVAPLFVPPLRAAVAWPAHFFKWTDSTSDARKIPDAMNLLAGPAPILTAHLPRLDYEGY